MIASSGNKRSRLRQYVGVPKRLLRKARDFYVDVMVSFDGTVGSTGSMTYPVSQMSSAPKNFGASSNERNNKKFFRYFNRSISNKYELGDPKASKISLNGGEERLAGFNCMDRSYSVTLGKIWTIDEEEPCEFLETMSEISMPRSRSHAVTRRNQFY